MPDAPNSRRLCAACRHWVSGYVGPQTWGFCCYREMMDTWRLPRVNAGGHHKISNEGKTLETRWDCSCPCFHPADGKPAK